MLVVQEGRTLFLMEKVFRFREDGMFKVEDLLIE